MNSIPIRQIDQTPAPERYARGWHCLGLSTTFTDEPSAITAFGTRIVVFRDSAGQAIVLEAICPHMGGDLTMGKVDGDVVRCPYHDWGWGAEGMCLDIPYAKKIPKKVPKSAPPIKLPNMAGGWSIDAIVLTIPKTAATMPSAGKDPARCVKLCTT